MPYKDEKKQREYQRVWSRNKTTKISRRRSKLKMKYGITLEEYATLLEKQGGACAICKQPPPDNTYLAVDHDHETKTVRGLLCLFCNTALGMFMDSLDLLNSAVTYLNPRSYNG